MKKKILIGSIIAVAILIGVSFTSVVGYRSVDSDVKASPLFNIRSSRAIDEKSEELSCAYVGKGNDINLLIPDRDNEIKGIQKSIEILQSMGDIKFNQFVNFVMNKIKKNEFKDVKSDDVILALNRLRNHQDLTISNITNMEEIYTIGFEFVPTLCWLPGCFLIILLLISILLLLSPLLLLVGLIGRIIFHSCDCAGGDTVSFCTFIP